MPVTGDLYVGFWIFMILEGGHICDPNAWNR
jgi:hypothetical protein